MCTAVRILTHVCCTLFHVMKRYMKMYARLLERTEFFLQEETLCLGDTPANANIGFNANTL